MPVHCGPQQLCSHHPESDNLNVHRDVAAKGSRVARTPLTPTEHVVCNDRATAGPLGRAGGAGETQELTAQGQGTGAREVLWVLMITVVKTHHLHLKGAHSV